MKTRQELTEILDFIADYATYLLASGVHTSRVIRNSQRIGQSQGVDIQLSSFQKSTILTVRDDATGEAVTRVVKIPALPISFERNSDLSALSWDALDEGFPLSEIRRRYDELTAKPRIDPIFVLLTVGLANASFCRLFGGDWIAMGIVFTSTLVGFAAKQRMQAHGVNHFLIFIISAFMASLCASAALRFDCSAETALATSVLFLVPGVPLINGVIDIVEGHVLIGCSRLIGALLLTRQGLAALVCGLAATALELVLCGSWVQAGGALAAAVPFLRLADLWLLLGLVWGSLPAARRAVDDLKYTRSTRMMLVACGVLLAAHTVLRIASLAAPASVPLGKASSGSFVVFSVLLLWYTVLMVKAYNVQRTKH